LPELSVRLPELFTEAAAEALANEVLWGSNNPGKR
jgi:hypothetical protein